jgi:hypothetical protein
LCQAEQWHSNQCEIFDVHLEEIAQADARLDGLDIHWWFGVLGGLELIFPWFDSLGHQAETEVGDFLVSENTFLQVDFEVIFVQSGEDFVRDGEVFLVGQ